MRPESPVKVLSYGISVKSWWTLTPGESAIANTLRQLIAERNAALAAEARRAAARSSPSRTQDEIGLRDAAITIETVLAKHGLLPGADAATEPEAGAGTAGDSGSRETR